MSEKVVKWVHVRIGSDPIKYLAEERFTDYSAGFFTEERDTEHLSEARIHDIRCFARPKLGYRLLPISKKRLFEVKLKGR